MRDTITSVLAAGNNGEKIFICYIIVNNIVLANASFKGESAITHTEFGFSPGDFTWEFPQFSFFFFSFFFEVLF